MINLEFHIFTLPVNLLNDDMHCWILVLHMDVPPSRPSARCEKVQNWAAKVDELPKPAPWMLHVPKKVDDLEMCRFLMGFDGL